MAGRVASLDDLAAISAEAPPGYGAAMSHELPGLDVAFHEESVLPRLQVALMGASSRYQITSCTPGQATHVPGERLLLRYRLEVTDGERSFDRIAIATLWPSAAACRRYVESTLRPLAHAARGHHLLCAFASPVALLEDLAMSVSAFPLDGELPSLVAATDPTRMSGPIERALGRRVHSCSVALGHYGRRHRCVLRYDVSVDAPGGSGTEPVTLWGKVAADGRGAVAYEAIRSLGARGDLSRLRVPIALAYEEELRLLLLEDVAGAASMGALVKRRVRDDSIEASSPSLETALDRSAECLARLHASGIELGPRRGPSVELAGLGEQVTAVGSRSEPLGRRLARVLAEADARLATTAALPECTSHGDFSHTQMVFDGDRAALVDFDTVCRAEPALDLGHFSAYLRLAAAKADRESSRAVADGSVERFVSAYLDGSGAQAESARIRERLPAYELMSLVRLAIHSWQKLKPARLSHVLSLLEE